MRALPLLLVMAALANPAVAQIEPSARNRHSWGSFKGLDSNGDGGLTRAELRARGAQKGADSLFAMLDGDGDGRLSLKEFTGTGNGPLLGRFEAYDADKNGFVAKREFPKDVDPLLLAALDRNHDRLVAMAEINPAFAGARVARAAAAARPVAKPPQSPASIWCWVPAIGDDGWGLEAPVLWGRCHNG